MDQISNPMKLAAARNEIMTRVNDLIGHMDIRQPQPCCYRIRPGNQIVAPCTEAFKTLPDSPTQTGIPGA